MLAALLLFGIVFALFAPSIRYSLVDLDDLVYTVQNRIVAQGLSPGNVRKAFAPDNPAATMYMPLLWISYMADVTFFGASLDNPAPFHATNVILHALSAVLLFLLLRSLLALSCPPSPPSLFIRHSSLVTIIPPFLLALLWALHPLRVESVAWVAERKDVLAAFFALLATLAYIKAWEQGRPANDGGAEALPPPIRHSSLVTRHCNKGCLCFALLAFVAGLLAKPSLVPLPLAWLALDVWPLRRVPSSPRAPGFFPAALRAAAEKLLFLPFALAAAWLAVSRHHAVSGSLAIPWANRLVAVAPNFLFYLRKTLRPFHLSPLLPEQWMFPLSTFLLSLAVCIALGIAVWFLGRAFPSLFPGAVWLLLFFLPASGLQPLPMNTIADRFFYLPSIGLSIALLSLFAYCAGSKHPSRDWEDVPSCRTGGSGDPPTFVCKHRFSIQHSAFSILSFAFCILLAALSALTLRLLPLWTSTDTLYRHVADMFPAHPRASAALAKSAIRKTGDFDAAEAILLPALAQNPDVWLLRFAYADCLLHRVSPDAAIDFIRESPIPEDRYTLASIHFLLANYEYFRQDYPASLQDIRRAIPLYGEDSTARTPSLLLAMAAAFDAGDLPQAVAFARQTRLYPDISAITTENLLPLAIFHWISSYREQAAALFLRILDDSPGRTDLWNNVLWGLATADWSPVPPSEVLERTLLMQASSPLPGHPGILDTLAAAQANAGDFDAARQTIAAALVQVPDSPTPFRQRLLDRQAVYESRRPYRESAFERLFSVMFGSPADVL